MGRRGGDGISGGMAQMMETVNGWLGDGVLVLRHQIGFGTPRGL